MASSSSILLSYIARMSSGEHRPLPGRGAQSNPASRFQATTSESEEPLQEQRTVFRKEHPASVVNPVNSPDLPMSWSLNPYQGCEHGCAYCYARPTHEYWGFGPGLDFEQQIMYKPDAPDLLRRKLRSTHWKPETIVLSGNTDCYQPYERTAEITRSLLKVFLEHRNPVSIITKNALVLRDLDLLAALGAQSLVHVNISVTTLDDGLRRRMEPRTASVTRKLEAIRALSEARIPVNIMVAPVIPGLTDHEIPRILEATSAQGARSASYTMIRLNGPLPEIFKEWITLTYPDRAEKVMQQIASAHGGQHGDSMFGRRGRGSGPLAGVIRNLFEVNLRKYFSSPAMPELRTDLFTARPWQGKLFDQPAS